MKLHQLKELVNEHNQIPFPPHPEDDALSDWMLDFYQMENTLKSISVDLEEDKIILNSCFAYMESLRDIINELEAINSKS